MKFMTNKKNRTSLSVIVLAVLVLVSVLLPLPYYIETPGSAENINEYVRVDNRENTHPGAYYLTTVAIQRGTPLSLAMAKFLPFREIISKEELMGESDDQDYERISQYEMDSSENMAKKVAFDLAKKKYSFQFQGVYVMGVMKDSSFYNQLETGDIVYQIDNFKPQSSKEFIDYIKSKKVEEQITVHYKRDGQANQVSGPLILLGEPKRPGIGITLADKTQIKTKEQVDFLTEEIGGPSGGLMFTLELYEILSGEDLRQGRQVAGTGTIEEDGKVGSIGGIDKKIVAADKAGASIFFAPSEPINPELKKMYPDLLTNYEEAKRAGKKIKTNMKIVPVNNIQEAMDYLKESK